MQIHVVQYVKQSGILGIIIESVNQTLRCSETISHVRCECLDRVRLTTIMCAQNGLPTIR